MLVQVKSGKVRAGDVRDLRGTLDREGAALGVYHSPGWERDYPRLQIITIADLLNGAEVKMPPGTLTFKQAEKVKSSEAEQKKLL